MKAKSKNSKIKFDIYIFVKDVIGVMDSGIGGASILKEVMKILPNEKFIYFADTKNAPYGNKKKNEIYALVRSNVDFLIKEYGIKMLIVACNTATSVCADKLRKEFPFPIVCVEPPIKVALDNGYKKILVIATKQTLKTNITIKNSLKCAKKEKIYVKKLGFKGLARQIDENLSNLYLVYSSLQILKEFHDFDALVIGCTHYNFVKDQIQEVLPTIDIISCEKQVAERTKFVLKRNHLLSEGDGGIKIILSKENSQMREFLERYL